MSVKTSSLNAYTEEEILVSIAYVIDAKYLLLGVEQQHGDQLLRSFRSSGYNHDLGMTPLTLQADGNLAYTSVVSMLERAGILSTLRDGPVLATVDGRHRRSCVSQLLAESMQS